MNFSIEMTEKMNSQKISTTEPSSDLNQFDESDDSSCSTVSVQICATCYHTPCSLIKYREHVEATFLKVVHFFGGIDTKSVEDLNRFGRDAFHKGMFPLSRDLPTEYLLPRCVEEELSKRNALLHDDFEAMKSEVLPEIGAGNELQDESVDKN